MRTLPEVHLAQDLDDVYAMANLVSVPEPGQLVRVRQRHFVVMDVLKSTLPTGSLGLDSSQPQHVVSLSSVEDDALGEELTAMVSWSWVRSSTSGWLRGVDGFDDDASPRNACKCLSLLDVDEPVVQSAKSNAKRCPLRHQRRFS